MADWRSARGYYVMLSIVSLLGMLSLSSVQPTGGDPEAMAPPPIVYSRCARTEGSLRVTAIVVVDRIAVTVTKVLGHTDVLDALPDVTHFFDGFSAPCDLILRESTGGERVLYDCKSRSTEKNTCAALDAAVSFDAKTVAFAVFRGSIERRPIYLPPRFFHPAAEGDEGTRVVLPNAYLVSREAQLYLVDVASGTVRGLPHQPGVFDSGPAWLSDGRLAFTSTRSGQFSSPVIPSQRPASQMFSMDPDGRNVAKASYHALAGEQHPLQLADGRVAMSSWQIFGMLPYRHDNGAPGNMGTLDNFFHLYSQFPDGANLFPLFGQHTLNHGGYEGAHPAHFAAHFVGQTTDRRVWVADYYRGNNGGLGQIVGFPLPPVGQEGIGPDDRPPVHDVYRPRGFVSLTSWASGFDLFSQPMPPPSLRIPTYADPLAYAGKVSHPAGLPGNALLLTWGVGACSSLASGTLVGDAPFTNGSGGFEALNSLTLLGRDNPGCDAGIYRTTTIPSRHPSDLVPVVNKREYHEIMARPLLAYAAVYGLRQPAVIPRADLASQDPNLPPGTPFGILGASSIVLRETRPIGGLPFSAPPYAFSLQGTDTVDYKDDDLCGIRILVTQPSQPDESRRYKTTVGERVLILGEFPVRKFDAEGRAVRDVTGAPDTSFKVRFPANVPYLMQAIDCAGRTLNTDQTWQHLRPGEVKTCNGCHVHGKKGLDFSRTGAANRSFPPVRLGEGTVPLLMGGSGPSVRVLERPGYGLPFEYERDVFPILQRRCASCHSSGAEGGGLVLNLPGTGPGSTYHRLVLDSVQEHVPAERRFPHPLRKPQLTKYVRALNSRGSLLYWKAANQRVDGRTDSQYSSRSGFEWEDVDFGASHPTEITAQELGILSRWLDTGAAAEAGLLLDTTPPTLHVAGRTANHALTTLYVGTVDVPSGVLPESLRVCVLLSSGACGPNLAGRALPSGTVVIDLRPPIADPNAQIRARVSDKAGNLTEVQWTVGWLMADTPTLTEVGR